MRILEQVSKWINRVLVWGGGAFLLAMIVITCLNIFLRLVWVPVRGTFELMGLFGAVTTAFALGYTQQHKGHIAVDVLVDTFPGGLRRGVNALNAVMCLVFIGLCAWQLAVKANTLMNAGEVTETLRIIYYPFTYAAALGCAVLGLVFLTDLIRETVWYKGDAK